MSGFSFIQRSLQHSNVCRWMRYSDMCPYNIGHKSRHLEFARDALFNKYCQGSTRPKVFVTRGGSEYRHGKLYKLFWKLRGEN